MYMMNMGLLNRIALVFASNWWDTGAHNGKKNTACWIDRLTSDNTNTPWCEFYSLTSMTGVMNKPVLIAFNSGNVAATVRGYRLGRLPVSPVSSSCSIWGHRPMPRLIHPCPAAPLSSMNCRWRARATRPP